MVHAVIKQNPQNHTGPAEGAIYVCVKARDLLIRGVRVFFVEHLRIQRNVWYKYTPRTYLFGNIRTAWSSTLNPKP